MTFATGNRMGIFAVEESNWGQTPANPTFQELRYTGEGISYSIENVTSDEIRSDRMVSDTVQVGQSTSGNLDFELSFGSYDSFLESALYSNFVQLDQGNSSDTITAGLTASNLDVALDSGASTVTFGSAYTIDVAVDQWLRLGGFTTSANNGYYRVTAVAGNVVTVSPAINTTETMENTATVSGARLRNSKDAFGILQKSFSLQKLFSDATPAIYQNFAGMIVGGVSLSFENGAILTGSFDFTGRAADISNSQIAGATTIAPTTTDVMNSVSNLQNIEFDNVPTTATIMSMSLEVNNSLREQKAIGSLPSVGIGAGRLEVTGSISLYFENLVEYQKFLDNQSFRVSFRLQDASGKGYVITLPKVKYEDSAMNVGGLDEDIMLEGSYRALAGSSDGVNYALQIDRLA